MRQLLTPTYTPVYLCIDGFPISFPTFGGQHKTKWQLYGGPFTSGKQLMLKTSSPIFCTQLPITNSPLGGGGVKPHVLKVTDVYMGI